MTMHQLPFGASISDAVLAELRSAAANGRTHKPEMIAEMRLVELCEDAMDGLQPSDGRLSFHSEPVNRVVAYSARPAPKMDWAILLFGRKFAHSIFRIGDIDVEIGEEAQAALKHKLLDVVDDKLVLRPI